MLDMIEVRNDLKRNGVPDFLAIRVLYIMERFGIYGLSNSMYIANIIGNLSGHKNSSGKFDQTDWSADIETDHVKQPRQSRRKTGETISGYLASIYGCNIHDNSFWDMVDLKTILANGFLESDRLSSGLKNSFSSLEQEKAEALSRNDMWRVGYLNDCMSDNKTARRRAELFCETFRKD